MGIKNRDMQQTVNLLQCKTSDQMGIFEDTYYIYLKSFPKAILKRHVLS